MLQRKTGTAVSRLSRVCLTCEHVSSFPSMRLGPFSRTYNCVAPHRHSIFSVWNRSRSILGNSMRQNVVKWANVEERHSEFNVGEARYTAIPVKANLPNLDKPGEKCLVTVVPAQAADLEDEHWLETCLRAFRGLKDDVWTPDFLDGLLISTPKSLYSPPSSGLVANIRRYTSWHAIVPGLDLPVSMSSTLVKLLLSSLITSRLVRTRCQRTCSVKCIVYMMTSKAHSWCLSSQCPRITGMFNDPYSYAVI